MYPYLLKKLYSGKEKKTKADTAMRNWFFPFYILIITEIISSFLVMWINSQSGDVWDSLLGPVTELKKGLP